MSQGRGRCERALLVAQAALVWTSAEAPALQEFIETGALPGSKTERMPYDPEVAKKIDEIIANGGRLIVES